MALAAKMDEFGGRSGWIAAMVLGFIFYWPVGLAFLFFLIATGRFRSFRHRRAGQWYAPNAGNFAGCGWGGSGWGSAAPSGNRAFDEYRSETLRRLEEEQKEFQAYLERLRQAKDKAEFDQFMAERRRSNSPLEPSGDAA